MSNGARLGAVIVVVVVASIGLYFAFMTPSGGKSADPAAPMDPLKSPEAIGSGTSVGDPSSVPPPEAFGPGSGTVGGAGSVAIDPAGAPGTVAVSGTDTGALGAGAGAATAAGTKSSGGVVPTGTGSAAATGTGSVPTSAMPVKPATPPVASAATEYTVKSGDTLEGIARAQLGDGQKWRSIVEINPGLDPKALKIGQKIKMPAGGTASAKEASAPAVGAGSASTNTYTVQKGDTLVAIARKFYGGDSDWKRILDANSSVLKGDAAALRPGMKLTIPAKR
jgi:nucleoid-associated protein YgaU